jgi:hypothetical protein
MLIAGLAVVLVGMNGSRFFSVAPGTGTGSALAGAVRGDLSGLRLAKPVIITKELAFLPGPETARVLSLGQAGTAAKLRWIDSFRYQQHVLDHGEDLLPDGSSVFVRLHDTLIPLDPLYLPFYQSAVTNLGGIIGRHGDELRYVMIGLYNLPHEASLHRQRASTLYTFFNGEAAHPEIMDAILDDWASSDPASRDQAWTWKVAMARRVYHGLEQVPYWQDQLARLTAGGQGTDPSAEYVRNILRQQLTAYAIERISAAAHGLELSPEQDAGWEILAERIRRGLAALPPEQQPPASCMPIARDASGVWHLRPDPWGLPWRQTGGVVTSEGLNRVHASAAIGQLNEAVRRAVLKAGRWPTSLDEVRALGITIPSLPSDSTLVLNGQALEIRFQDPPEAPWPLTAR